jgi:pimeloyl-ACP methyl ester carboxylesterase
MAEIRAGVNGVTLACEVLGAGEALLLIHGHPFDRSMWRPQVAGFGARGTPGGWRVIAPDLRGLGASTVPAGSVPWSAYAQDLAALLDYLDSQRAVVAGLSMGGQVALEFFRLFPGRVRALVLASTFAQLDSPERRRWRYELADRLEREGMAGYASEILPKMITPRAIADQPDVVRQVLGMMRSAPAAGAAAALRSRAERPDYTTLLPLIEVPALIVAGAEDEFTPVSDAEALRRGIPGSQLAIIDGAGHMPNLERPREFNDVVSRFLAAL